MFIAFCFVFIPVWSFDVLLSLQLGNTTTSSTSLTLGKGIQLCAAMAQSGEKSFMVFNDYLGKVELEGGDKNEGACVGRGVRIFCGRASPVLANDYLARQINCFVSRSIWKIKLCWCPASTLALLGLAHNWLINGFPMVFYLIVKCGASKNTGRFKFKYVSGENRIKACCK